VDRKSAYLREAQRPIADQLADEKAAIARVKARYAPSFAVGERVELVSTTDDYTNLEPGDRGTVTAVRGEDVYPEPAISVAWDRGSSLTILPDSGDRIRKVGS
jgi:folate-binding Fe-S cluster repair protein YgfZ